MIQRFKTNIPEEFQRFLFFELAIQELQANPEIKALKRFQTATNWTYKVAGKWEIAWNGNVITCDSTEDFITIREGLAIDMKGGKIIINSHKA